MLKNSIENHVFSNYFAIGLGRAGGNEGYLGILNEAKELVLKFKNWTFSSSKMATDLSFHFTKETPANQMFNDVKSLNKFNDESFKKFLNLVLHFLSGSSDVEEFQTNLELFSQELGASLTPLKNITKTLLIFFKHAVKQHLSPQFVKDDMEKLGKILICCIYLLFLSFLLYLPPSPLHFLPPSMAFKKIPNILSFMNYVFLCVFYKVYHRKSCNISRKHGKAT